MAISKGIHIFYISPRRATGSRDRTTGVNLYRLHMNGTKVLSLTQINLETDVKYGVSAVMDNGWLNIFVSLSDGTLIKVSTEDCIKFYHEPIPSTKTINPTSAIVEGKNIKLYSRSYSDKYKVDCIQRNVFSRGRWSGNTVILGTDNKPIWLNGGPCAVMQGQSTILLFSQDNNRLKSLKFNLNGPVIDFSPTNFYTPNIPTAVSFLKDNEIMVAHHGSNNNKLYAAIFNRDNVWPDKEDTPYNSLLNDNPGSCIYGNRVYMFFQGTNNNLYLQIYMGNSWLPEVIPVMMGDKPINEVWYGPAVIAV